MIFIFRTIPRIYSYIPGYSYSLYPSLSSNLRDYYYNLLRERLYSLAGYKILSLKYSNPYMVFRISRTGYSGGSKKNELEEVTKDIQKSINNLGEYKGETEEGGAKKKSKSKNKKEIIKGGVDIVNAKISKKK